MTTDLGPWIVTGMHRSGTSLTASSLAEAGVHLGDRLLDGDARNPLGYFEDCDFLDLDRRILTAACRSSDGHPDWGWSDSEELDRTVLADFRDEARELVAARAARGRPWGFKDPRATLLLDFWREHTPQARFLLVYRLPWEVADSMQRLGADLFLRRPEMGYRVWAFYNRHLLDFYRRHRDRSVLVSIDAAVRDAGRFAAVVREKLELDLPAEALARRFDRALLRLSPADDPLGSLISAAHPECRELLAALDAEADLSGENLWRSEPLRARPIEDTPRVSVVIPCRDDGQLLLEAVASAERSVKCPFELVVVDDGSTDPDTGAIFGLLEAAGYAVHHRPHGGVASARNFGFGVVRASAVIPLDADNRLLPGFVENALAVLDDEPLVGAVYCDRMEFGKRRGRVEVGPFDAHRLMAGNYVDACAVVRRQAWYDSGGYDQNMPLQGWEDWDIWMSMIERRWLLRWLPLPGFEYRVRPNSMVHALEASAELPRLASHIVGKHHLLYIRTIDEFVAAQRATTRTLRETTERLEATSAALAERDRSFAETAAVLAERSTALAETSRSLAQANATLEERCRDLGETRRALDATRSENCRLKEERRLSKAQRISLHAGLESWRRWSTELEGTRALRLRSGLLRLRSRLERRRQTGPAYPCVIGAIGGSGTRVFARIIELGGLRIGEERNEFEDALPIERFLDDWVIAFWQGGGSRPPHVSPPGIDEAMAVALARQFGGREQQGPCGWKSPRSLYLLPYLAQRFPGLRFLHVLRDGRDIAFSQNQLQLERYGGMLLSPAELEMSQPERSMALWCRINLWAADVGDELGSAYLRVRWEDLCANPVTTCRRVLRFFELPGSARAAARLVEQQDSLGRWRAVDAVVRSRLEEIGGAALRRFGYL